jgi:hypothetical protein
MGTEVGDTVFQNIKPKELLYTIAVTSKAPGWFIEFVKNIDDCNVNIKSIISLMNYLKVPDWVNEVVNAWIKVNYTNKDKNNI